MDDAEATQETPPPPARRSGGIRLRLPHFFIERPIFAAVVAILIVILGIIAYPTLPVAQYPEIAPPTVLVTANYPGANAQTMAETVAQPLEEAINGVEHMIYIQSSSTGDGKRLDHRHLRAGHQYRSGAGAGAEPCRDGRAAASRRGPLDRRHHPQELARPADDHAISARPTIRSASNTSATTSRCSWSTGCRAYRRRRHPAARRARLQHADLDRSGPRRGARHSRSTKSSPRCGRRMPRSPQARSVSRRTAMAERPISSTSRPRGD